MRVSLRFPSNLSSSLFLDEWMEKCKESQNYPERILKVTREDTRFCLILTEKFGVNTKMKFYVTIHYATMKNFITKLYLVSVQNISLQSSKLR